MASAASVALAACGDDDAVLRDVSIGADPSTSAGSPTTTPAVLTPVSSTATASPDAAVVADPAATTTTTTATTTTSPIASNAVPNGSEMIVAFTYQQAPGGKNLAPYTAVWLEDADGSLVHTIALWREQDRKGAKYLPELKRWFSVNETQPGGIDAVDVLAGPTRFPGQYAVTWTGESDLTAVAAVGAYFVCIEASREDGPYSLIRERVSLTGQPLDQALPDSSELVGASVSVA